MHRLPLASFVALVLVVFGLLGYTAYAAVTGPGSEDYDFTVPAQTVTSADGTSATLSGSLHVHVDVPPPPPPPPPPPSCSEPTSPANRLFSCASTFNTKLPADVPIRPDSSAMTGADWVKGYDANTILRPWLGLWKQFGNVVHVPAGTANVSVKMDNPSCNVKQISLPIPPGTTAPKPSPENAAVFLTADGKTYEVYQLTAPGVAPYNSSCPADASWHIRSYAIPSWGIGTSDWTGLGYGKDSIRASDVSLAAGMVRPSSLTSPYPDTFGHAIAIATWRACASGQTHPRFVAPATDGDGAFTGLGCIPMGARLQLDPAYNLDTDAWVIRHGAWAKTYLKTLQVYGAVIVDSGAQAFWQEYNLPGGVNPYGGIYPWATPSEYNIGCFTAGCDQSASIGIPNAVMARFRVIDWTRWSGP